MRQQVSLASYLTFELFVNAGTYVDASQQLFAAERFRPMRSRSFRARCRENKVQRRGHRRR